MWQPDEFHRSVHVLLQFTQFCIRRQVRGPPYGPWDHVPPHVWTDKATQLPHKMRERMRHRCMLYFVKGSTITVFGECQEHYCEFIDPHLWG